MFSDINISQGSEATRLKCGGFFSNDFVANFLLNITVKEFFKNRPVFGESYGREFGVLFFKLTGYMQMRS